MDNESLYLCSTSALPMGGLMCTTHLLPLLRPLLFIINARNKCVMLAWVVIMENEDSSLFFDSSISTVEIQLSLLI